VSHGTNNVGKNTELLRKEEGTATCGLRFGLVILFHCDSTKAGLGIFMSNKLNVINDAISDKEGSKKF